MIYNKELAHMITETEKSHDLPSISWGFRKANGVNASSNLELKTRSTDGAGLKTVHSLIV
jgi:hypothetical protein